MTILEPVLITLALTLLPMLAGHGLMRLVIRRRGDGLVDFGPWKMMAALVILPTLTIIAAMVWTSMSPMDYTEFREPKSFAAEVINALSLLMFLMPGAYVGAAVTGAMMGVAKRRAYLVVFTLLAPLLVFGWYFLVLALSCVTTGACL